MRSVSRLAAVSAAMLIFAACVFAGPKACTTIQSGKLLYSPTHYLAGQPIKTGVNPYGYNYQAHSFNGSYFNSYAGGAGLPPWDGDDAAYLAQNPAAANHWAWPYRNIDVAMKWNDAWLSNQDCDGDTLLDRYFGFTSYVGSGAWLTNHFSYAVEGVERTATEFTKIVARPVGSIIDAPANDYFGEQTIWFNGVNIGPQLWGDFAVIQELLNDPDYGNHGVMLKSAANAGFGTFKP